MAIVWKKDEIRRRREGLHLSQSEASDRAGFTTLQQWSNIERGQSSERPSAETMLRVARALGCQVEDLITLDDAPAEAQKAKPAKGKGGKGKAG